LGGKFQKLLLGEITAVCPENIARQMNTFWGGGGGGGEWGWFLFFKRFFYKKYDK
jgi:hypothetical protein